MTNTPSCVTSFVNTTILSQHSQLKSPHSSVYHSQSISHNSDTLSRIETTFANLQIALSHLAGQHTCPTVKPPCPRQYSSPTSNGTWLHTTGTPTSGFSLINSYKNVLLSSSVWSVSPSVRRSMSFSVQERDVHLAYLTYLPEKLTFVL